MRRYRRAIFHRVPVINRKPLKQHREPICRKTICKRTPITSVVVEYDGCGLINSTCEECALQQFYCDWDASLEDYDYNVIRLIRIQDIDDTKELLHKIQYVESIGCYLRLITDVPLEDEVLYALGYNSLNVVQFNINILDELLLNIMKHSIFTADNCGIYVSLMLFPIIPEVTHTSQVLEILNAFRCSCNIICFKYLEIPVDFPSVDGYFNVNGNCVSSEYYIKLGDKFVVNAYFRRTFSTVISRFLSPRKVNCSSCNEHVCY